MAPVLSEVSSHTLKNIDLTIKPPSLPRQVRATYSVLISLDLPGQVLDIVKSLTSELRLSSLNNILTSVVEEIYVLHEKEDWVLDMSDQVKYF